MRGGPAANEAHTDLMEEEASKTGGNDGVTDQEVPVDPLPLDPAEGGKVGTSVEFLCRIFVEDGRGGGSCVKGHDRGGEGGKVENSGDDLPSCILITPSKIGPLYYSSHGCYASRSALTPIRVRLAAALGGTFQVLEHSNENDL